MKIIKPKYIKFLIGKLILINILINKKYVNFVLFIIMYKITQNYLIIKKSFF